MSPRGRGPRRPHGRDANEQLPWSIVYYQAPDGSVPGLEFLDGCPGTVDAQFTAVLDAVAAAPPPKFSGGGKWEAMHGTMGGWYEIRLTGPGREQLRLFCLLENGRFETYCAHQHKRTVGAIPVPYLRTVKTPPGATALRDRRLPPNHRDQVMAHYPDGGHDSVAGYRPEAGCSRKQL